MSTTELFNKIEQSGILYGVRREKLFTENGVQYLGRDALVNEITGKPVAIVSPRYKLVTNREIVSNVLEAVDAAKLDTTGSDVSIMSSENGARSIVTLTMPAYSVLSNTNNKTMLSISALNSYNGSTRFIMKSGGIRVACLNGQIMGKITGAYSEYHNSSLDVAKATKQLSEATSRFFESEEWFTRLMNRPVTDAEVKALICKFLGFKEDMYDKSRVVAKLREIAHSYFVEMGKNAYALYNAFTDFVTHRKRNPSAAATSYSFDANRLERLINKTDLFV